MSIRQKTQAYNSNAYVDNTAPGAGMEPAISTSDLETDLNNIRSMINEIVSSQGGNWYDPLGGRDVNTLSIDLLDLEDKTVLCRVSELENVTVAAASNNAILTAPTNTPSTVAAIGAGTTLGAVCAELPGAPGTGSTLTVAGQNLIQPKSLLTLVDIATGEPPVDSSGKQIYGLLQIANGALDGAAFDNAANQGQISFVVVNAGRTGFDLTTDAQGLTLQYAYVNRTTLDLIPEECFIPYAGFVDNSASVEVTLTNAYANQGTGAAPLSTNITSQTNAVNQSWDVINAAGANIASLGVGAADGNVLVILGDAAAAVDSITRINGTDLDINVTNAATVANGMTFEGTPAIDIGVTDGLIESTGALTLESNSGNATLQSTTGGNVVLTSAAAINGTTPNAADASGNGFNLTLGNSTAGVAAGAAATFNTGDGFGSGSGGNFTVNLGSGGASGVAGYMDVNHGGTDVERVVQLAVTGTGADQIGIFVGSLSPNARVNAGGDIGSLFVDGTSGTMYINTDGATAWSPFAVGGAESWAATLAVGNTSGGTDAVMSVGDVLRGVDGAVPGALNLNGGDATVAAVAGATAALTGGSGNTTGAGGAASVTGGTPGVTGTGGAATLAGAAGGATSGDGGAATVQGGASTSGVGGSVTIQSGASLDGNSGLLTIQVPDATSAGSAADNIEITGGAGGTGAGAADGSNIVVTAGAGGSGSSGAGGDVTIDAGPSGGSSSSSGGVLITTGTNTGSNVAGVITLTTTDNNSADAGSISITGGNVTGAAEGGGVNISSGHGAAAGTGGSVFIGGAPGSVANGAVTISTNLITDTLSQISQVDPIVNMSNAGAGAGGGQSFGIYSGTTAPTHTAETGSLFHFDDGSTGRLYLNTSAAGSGATWELVQIGAGDTSLSEAITLEGAGNFTATNSTSWGNADGQSVAFTGPAGGGDEILEISALAAGDTVDVNGALTVVGDAGAPGQSHSITGGAGAAATNSGGGVSVVGGAGNTTGTGGTITATGGAGGATGNGGGVDIDGGAGGATSGDGGSITIDAGGATTGNAGSVGITGGAGGTALGNAPGGVTVTGGAAGAGSGSAGGTVTILGGNADGTGAGGSITATAANAAAVGGAGGSVTLSAGSNAFLTNGNGGSASLAAGTAQGATFAAGGATVSAGAGTSGALGGTLNLIGGNSDASGETIGSAGAIVGVAGNNSGTDRAGDISFTAGTNSSAGGEGGRVAINGGVSAGPSASPTFELVPGSTTGAGANGNVHVNGVNAESESVFRLSTTGTLGDSVEMFVGTSDPNGSITGLAGSLFFRDTGATGELYLNTSSVSGTTWSLVVTGTPAAETWATTLAAGNISGGTDPVLSGGDTFRGVDGASVTGMTIRGGNATGAATNGGSVSIDGGSATDGNGGSVAITAANGTGTNRNGGNTSMVAGNGTGTGTAGSVAITAGNTATATGGTVDITSGTATTTGASGGINISTGTPVDGAGGSITLDAANAVGATLAGGDVVMDAGDSTGTEEGGLVILRSGDSATGDAGYVRFDMPNDDDEHIIEFITGGTNGTTTQLLTGTQNPDTVVSALPGSLYLRRVVAAGGSALFVNDSNAAGEGTDWGEVLTSSSRTIAQGVAASAITASTDVSNLAPASNVTMDFGTFPTIPSTQAEMDVRTKVYVNGLLQRSGITVVRTGTQATAVQFNFALSAGDVITVEQWSA